MALDVTTCTVVSALLVPVIGVLWRAYIKAREEHVGDLRLMADLQRVVREGDGT